jgi:hypothetical protein
MAEIKVIANRLADLLQDELGTYKLPNGLVVPSFAIVPPQLDGRIDFETPSVEMIIYKTPEVRPLPVFAGGTENYYRVLLTQRKTNGSLSNAIALMMTEFGNPEMKTRQLQEEDSRRGLLFEQVVFMLCEDCFLEDEVV